VPEHETSDCCNYSATQLDAIRRHVTERGRFEGDINASQRQSPPSIRVIVVTSRMPVQRASSASSSSSRAAISSKGVASRELLQNPWDDVAQK
jgi:hypothetical protein